ncbi:MAG: flippase-like domain-containing protein [Chitinispirillia bacterium]|nr:flippase-like domain-containing protein [Chitinispirillia bacterium]MCL2268805.1 flippase-like domain-containing protein [Chitinispirillia bacterium]
MRSKFLPFVIGLLLTALGLYLFFRKTGDGDEAVFKTLAAEIANTHLTAVVACVVLAVLSMWMRGARLGIMLPDGGQPKRKRGLFAITTISYMINNILPVRLGEAARVLLLWRRGGYPVTVSIGGLLLERALDIIVYLSFLFVPVFLSPEIAAALRGVHPVATVLIWLSFAAFVAMIGMFTLYALMPRVFRAVFMRLGGIIPPRFRARAGKICAELESSLGWIFSPAKAACVVALSFATALCYAAMLTALVPGWLGANGAVNSVFAQAFASFGAAIPLAPGSVGTLHAVLLQGMTVLGVEAGKARAAVVLYHGIQYVIITALGLILLMGMHIRIKDITVKSGPS